MSRALDAGTLATVRSDASLQMFHLITMYFSTVQRMTEHVHNITYNFGLGAETFISSGRLMSLSNIEEEQSLSNPSISLGITGASAEDVALMMAEKYTNVRVIIRRGFYDTSGQTSDVNIVGKPFIIFDGKIDSWSFKDDPSSGNSAISWNISSHWVDWERTNGRKTNPQNNKIEFPLDNSYNFVYDRIGDRVWGKVTS